jgi:hypothetical protein
VENWPEWGLSVENWPKMGSCTNCARS